MASVLYLDRPEVLDVNVPPYIDPTERGSYDTDELDALEAACAALEAACAEPTASEPKEGAKP